MKKILALLFMIMMFCSVCSAAFPPPDPSRWQLIGGNYIDIQTLNFSKEDDGIHAVYTVRNTLANDDKHISETREEMNLSRKEYRVLALATYDEKGNVDFQYIFPHDKINTVSITPGSSFDHLCEGLLELYKKMNGQ